MPVGDWASLRTQSVSVRLLGPIDLPPNKFGPEIVDFGGASDPSRAPIPSKQEGCDVPHLSGRVGKSTGPIRPKNLTHHNSYTDSSALRAGRIWDRLGREVSGENLPTRPVRARPGPAPHWYYCALAPSVGYERSKVRLPQPKLGCTRPGILASGRLGLL